MAYNPSNETILEQLKHGFADFQIASSPVPSVSSHCSQNAPPAAFLTSITHKFFARIGPSLGQGSPAMKKLERYSVQKITGDGRCLFRALVKGMAHNKGVMLNPREERENADELRMAVKEVICDNDKERLKYEEALIAITVEESLKRYCQRIGRPDFWGGESELLVLSKLCCQPIIVYIPEHEHGGWGSSFIPIAEYGAEFRKGTKKVKPRHVVRLLYSGFVRERESGRRWDEQWWHVVPRGTRVEIVRGALREHCIAGSILLRIRFGGVGLRSRPHRAADDARCCYRRFPSEQSHNVSLDGDFSIQVLEKALDVWDLQVIQHPSCRACSGRPRIGECIYLSFAGPLVLYKVNGEWYNFDSLHAAPEHLSKFYLSA